MRTRLAFHCVGAALIATMAACNDNAFLTEVPKDFVGPEQFYRNAADATAAINSVYSAFINGTGDGYYGRNFWMLVEYPTEAVTAGRLSGTNERSQPDNYSVNSTHAYIETVWSSAYTAINRANAVIDNVPGIPMDETLRSRIVNEAKYLRALHYFNLVRLFGGVPIHLTSTTGLDNAGGDRQSADSTYHVIENDLHDALALPTKSQYAAADRGRATAGAAQTLLGKVYLQRAATVDTGTTLDTKRLADLDSAEKYLRMVVTNGAYSLVPNYWTLFDFYGGTVVENNNEVIFEIQNVRSPGLGGRLSSHMAPNATNPYLGASTNGSVGAEYNFWTSYAATDTRRDGTWMPSWNKNGVAQVWSPTASNTTNQTNYGAHVPFPRKFLDVAMPSVGTEEPNFPILRYADVLLMLAEVINEKAGPTLEAQGYVNQVRARASLGALPATDVVDFQTFKNAIFRERRWELVLEGHGHFDSVRNWAWAKSRIEPNLVLGRVSANGNRYPRNNPASPCTGTGAASVCALTDTYKVYPIPQRAIDVNPRITQNPGY